MDGGGVVDGCHPFMDGLSVGQFGLFLNWALWVVGMLRSLDGRGNDTVFYDLNGVGVGLLCGWGRWC